MLTVKEISEITGISIRTLHYYDSIDLLKPTKVTEKGYRLYDKVALNRLQTILMYRELRFSLKDIKRILDNPNFDSKCSYGWNWSIPPYRSTQYYFIILT